MGSNPILVAGGSLLTAVVRWCLKWRRHQRRATANFAVSPEPWSDSMAPIWGAREVLRHVPSSLRPLERTLEAVICPCSSARGVVDWVRVPHALISATPRTTGTSLPEGAAGVLAWWCASCTDKRTLLRPMGLSERELVPGGSKIPSGHPNLCPKPAHPKEVKKLAGNQEEAVKRALRQTGSRESPETKKAYDAYCQSMRNAGQTPKSLKDFR